MAKVVTDISAEYIHLLTRGALRQGLTLENILRRAGIPRGIEKADDARLTFHQISMLYKVIWIETGDENMGLSDAPLKLGSFRFLADILSSFQRLESVLAYASRFYELTRNDMIFQVEQKNGSVQVIVDVASKNTDPDSLLNEYYLMAWQRYICWLIGQQIEWSETTFSYPRPARADIYSRLFSGELCFSHQLSSFSFDSKYLKRRINRSRAEVEQYVTMLPLPLFTQGASDAHYSQRIREILAESNFADLPGLHDVANSLSMNPRTIHRKLSQEGTSFNHIKAQYRCDEAAKCLIEKNMSIQEISEFLGFSEPSSFCRFFKSITGLPPSKYTTFFN